MIEFKDIGVRYGTQVVLEHVSFRINKGERVGIVGPNGSGKSTLFRLILDEAFADTGSVVIEESPRIGHIRQHLKPDSEEETLLAYALRGISGVTQLETEIHDLEHRLSQCGEELERNRLLKRLGEVQTAFEHLGGYDIETRVKASLGGLGFSVDAFQKPFTSFSGGWQMRAELSRVLASHPDLLLLDEPSNYLDLPAIEWLQRFLRGYDGTLVLISHDRFLLRTLTKITVEVDAQTVTRYNGDLDYYLREREIRYRNLLAAKENQDRRIEQLERFVDRFKATATKAAQAQSRIKMIEKIEAEAVVLPKRSLAAGYLRLPEAPHSGAEIVRMEHLDFSYDGIHPVLRDVNLSIARGDKVAIIGYNGMGKTTLLRMMAGVRTPTAGTCTLGHKVQPGYLSQEFAETIPPDITVFECAKRARPNATEKELRSFLASFGFMADDIGKQAGVLSGGEKIRLAFLRLFLDPPNLMLLDEPTTHLDMEGRAALEKAVKTYNGTVCLVSHDIEFVRNTVTSIIEISTAGVRCFPGGFDYYQEKTAGETRDDDAGGRAAASGGATAEAPAAMTAKELRRVRAQERAKFLPRIRALKTKVEQEEKKIAELEAELEELSAVLFNPQPGTDFAATNKRLKWVQDQLDVFTEEWERDASELDRLQKEQDAAQDAVS
ncbi:MAG: ABC-F family ATP-binding cassette domain-containing protein [Kiritimatiellae bacterium]|nr:ABC-F family ATP-binding cassette domain-containing protein [Kiritimatiellia bacterium]